MPLPGHHLSQPSRGGGPGCPARPQGPQKRGRWRKTADRRAVSVEGQSHQRPALQPLFSSSGTSSLAACLCQEAQTWHPPPSDRLSPPEPGGLKAAQRPEPHGALQAEHGPSAALGGRPAEDTHGATEEVRLGPGTGSLWVCDLNLLPPGPGSRTPEGVSGGGGGRNLGSRGTRPGSLVLPFPPAAPFLLFH